MSSAAGARRPAAGARRPARNTGPVVRPRSSLGRRREVPVPVDVLDGTAFGGDAGSPELRIEVFDVEGEDLFRPGRGLVEHPPQDSLAQAMPVVGEQLFEAGARDGPVAAAGGLAAFQSPGG